MNKIFYFVCLASLLIWSGFEIQSGKFHIGGTTLNDSTTAITTFNKGVTVNGPLTTNLYDIVVPDGFALRMGDQANYPGTYISASTYDIVYDGHKHTFNTQYATPIMIIDSASGVINFSRVNVGKGTTVAGSTKITLGLDGNVFTVTGDFTLDTISTTRWTSGANIYLYFTGTVTINNQTTGTGRIYTQGSNLAVTAGDVYEFVLDGTLWRRVK